MQIYGSSLDYQRLVKDLHGVKGDFSRSILYLVAAACARRCDDRIRGLAPHGGKQHEFPDLLGQLEMLLFIAEGTGHSATSGRDGGYSIIGRNGQGFYRAGCRCQRFLLTM